jgi:hypothetical protein
MATDPEALRTRSAGLRERAADLRVRAERLRDPGIRADFLKIADEYGRAAGADREGMATVALERGGFRLNRLGDSPSRTNLIQHAGWRKEASMDGEALLDGPS